MCWSFTEPACWPVYCILMHRYILMLRFSLYVPADCVSRTSSDLGNDTSALSEAYIETLFPNLGATALKRCHEHCLVSRKSKPSLASYVPQSVSCFLSFLHRDKIYSQSNIWTRIITDDRLITTVFRVDFLPWHCWLGIKNSIWPVRNWVIRCWCGYLSGARCKWFAYGPANATATPFSLAPVKSRMVYLSGAGLPGLSWKRGH